MPFQRIEEDFLYFLQFSHDNVSPLTLQNAARHFEKIQYYQDLPEETEAEWLSAELLSRNVLSLIAHSAREVQLHPRQIFLLIKRN
jgi:hypothetical protein